VEGEALDALMADRVVGRDGFPTGAVPNFNAKGLDSLGLGGFGQGEGHVVEVEGEDGVSEEFEADGGVEEAVGFVDGFGGEVYFGAIFREGDALETFFTGVGDSHVHAAVGEREQARIGG
jgi:hypothetical protein